MQITVNLRLEIDRAEWREALRRDAEGFLPTMAAVELLIAHRHWLSRDPFRCWCVSWLAADDEGPAVATIAWNAAAGLLAGQLIPGEPCDTDSERGVLAVAASIAAGHPCDLGSALLSCDAANVARIADAVLAAGGSRSQYRRHRTCPMCEAHPQPWRCGHGEEAPPPDSK